MHFLPLPCSLCRLHIGSDGLFGNPTPYGTNAQANALLKLRPLPTPPAPDDMPTRVRRVTVGHWDDRQEHWDGEHSYRQLAMADPLLL